MNTVLKQIITGKDNNTVDIGRVTWLLGTVTIIALAIYEVMRGNVNLREIAESLGIITGASGVAVGIKKDAEP